MYAFCFDWFCISVIETHLWFIEFHGVRCNFFFQAWQDNTHQPSQKNTAPARNNVITWQGPSLPEETNDGGRGLTIIGTHHRNRGCPFGTESDRDSGVQLGGIDAVPHKGHKYMPQDHNAVVGQAWGADRQQPPLKNYVSENERDHIEHDFTVAAPPQRHGRRHFAGAERQRDHIQSKGGFVSADGPTDEGVDGHGKGRVPNRNVDHLHGIVGS